jgi:hypothetical protein
MSLGLGRIPCLNDLNDEIRASNLKHGVEIGLGGVDWIGLAQDTDNWRALVNAVMNLRVP